VPAGALFYGRSRRRREVFFDAVLREVTVSAAARFHQMVNARETPRVPRQPKCKRCSLLQICMPDITGPGRSMGEYIGASLQRLGNEGGM
jgi:CRISPR-associated exonuclease Cas4